MKSLNIYRFLFLLPCLLSVHLLSGQENKYLYSFFYSLVEANEPPSYFAFKFRPKSLVESRVVPLTLPEGKEGFKTEGNLRFNFPIFSKRIHNDVEKDSLIRGFFGYSRLNLKYLGNVRVAQDDSGPIIPPTNSFGLSYDRLLWFKFDKIDRTSSDRLYTFCNKVSAVRLPEENTIYLLYSTFSFVHYSNGQGPGALLEPDRLRNDYIQGNFSTNYWRWTTSGLMIKDDFIFTGDTYMNLTLGYQRDFGPQEGFLTFEEAQLGRYGKHRLIGSAQVRTGAITNCGFNLRFRMDADHIIDKKENIKLHPVQQSPQDPKLYRTGIHTYIDVGTTSVPAIGLLFHYYRGRDYLNIRYDDPVSLYQIGISIEFSRYTPKRFDTEAPYIWK